MSITPCLVVERLEARGLSVLLGADPQLGPWTAEDESLAILTLVDAVSRRPTRRGWAVLAALWREYPGLEELPSSICHEDWMAESAGYLAAGFGLRKALPAREAAGP